MNILIMARPDGTMFTRTTVEPRKKGENMAAYNQRLSLARPEKGAVMVDAFDHTLLPSGHQHFKDARRWDGAAVIVDMPAARVIKMGQIRIERDRRLVETDKEVSVLDGVPLPVSLKQKRGALRDLPATIQPALDAIAKPQALEAFQPTWPE